MYTFGLTSQNVIRFYFGSLAFLLVAEEALRLYIEEKKLQNTHFSRVDAFKSTIFPYTYILCTLWWVVGGKEEDFFEGVCLCLVSNTTGNGSITLKENNKEVKVLN